MDVLFGQRVDIGLDSVFVCQLPAFWEKVRADMGSKECRTMKMPLRQKEEFLAEDSPLEQV